MVGGDGPALVELSARWPHPTRPASAPASTQAPTTLHPPTPRAPHAPRAPPARPPPPPRKAEVVRPAPEADPPPPPPAPAVPPSRPADPAWAEWSNGGSWFDLRRSIRIPMSGVLFLATGILLVAVVGWAVA